MKQACEKVPMRVLACCLMPNHFHLVLWPYNSADLSRWMQWLLSAHVKDHRRKYRTVGRIWQGRFKSFLIQTDHHLLAVLRYVERNPVRARLVDRPQDWRWSSASPFYRTGEGPVICPGPLDRDQSWARIVSLPQTAGELDSIRASVNRERPFGRSDWVEETLKRMGLQSTSRPVGRPRKHRP
jgi:putative transposase